MNTNIPGVRQKHDNDLPINTTYFFMTLVLSTWRAETATMSGQQRGEYIELLVAAWEREGQLPADLAKLYELSRSDRSIEAFTTGCAPIFANFVVDGDRLEHPTLKLEHDKAVHRHSMSAEKGRKGGLAKAASESEDKDIPLGQQSAMEPKKEYAPHVKEMLRKQEAAKTSGTKQ